MRLIVLTFLLFISSLVLLAQQSHIQFIHNSPNLGTNSGPVVDIYVNGLLRPQLSGFEFREATAFLPFDPQENVVVDVRVHPSVPSDSIILTFEILEIEADENYTLVLGGVDINIPQLPDFQFYINNNARRTSSSETTVAINAFHGGIILPKVAISEITRGILYNVEYGNFADYQVLNSESYFFSADVENFGFPLNYVADFTEFGGEALTLFISGAALNSPEWGIFAATADGMVFQLPLTLLATAQLFNNIAGEAVDVYLDSTIWVEDLHFQSAIPFTAVESERILEFGIAPAGSESYDEVYTTLTAGFETDLFYTLVLNGTRDTMPFPISLDINDAVRPIAEEADQFDYSFFHGLQDTTLLSLHIQGLGLIVDSIPYGNYSEYFSLDTNSYFLDIRVDSTKELLYSFILELPPLLAGNSVTLVLSGDPANPGDVKMFAMFTDGSTLELERLLYSEVQFINNIPETNLHVFSGPELLVDSLEFREATQKVLVPSGQEVLLSLVSVADPIIDSAFQTFTVELTDTLRYTMVLNGTRNDDEYPLELITMDKIINNSIDSNQVDYSFFHGVYGVDSLDVGLFDGPDLTVNFPYKSFSEVFTTPNELTFLRVDSKTNEDVQFTFEGDFSSLGGSSITLLFSGTQNEELEMVLLGVEEDGSVFELRETSLAKVQLIHSLAGIPVDVYLDDEILIEDFTPDEASGFLNIEGGYSYQIGIAAAGSNSVADTVASFSFTAVGGEIYTIVVAGLPETEDRLFDLFINESSRLEAMSVDSVDLTFFQSTFFFDTVQFELLYEGLLVSDLPFGSYTDYQTVSDEYYLMRVFSDQDEFESFFVELDLRQNAGESFTLVFAEDTADLANPRILSVSATGNVKVLPRRELSRVQFIQNIDLLNADVFINGYLIETGFAYASATSFLDIVGDRDVDITLLSADDGTEILSTTAQFNSDKTYIGFFDGSLRDDSQALRLSLFDAARESYDGPMDSLSLAFHHGAFALDSLDIIFQNDSILADGLEQYGFLDYQNFDSFASLLDVFNHGDATRIATFLLDLRSRSEEVLMAWINYSTTEENRFSLFVTDVAGNVEEFNAAGEAFVQLLHNAPTSSVDIYLNGQLFLEELAFRTGTAFVMLPADVPLEIEIALHSEESSFFETTIMLEDEASYIAVANGITGNMDTPFELLILGNARRMAVADDQTEISFFHGAPDSPVFTFDSRNFGLLVNELAYGEFTDYLALDTSRYLIDLKDQLSGDLIESYEADFSGIGGRSGLIFASGVEGEPDAEFGLFLLLDSGLVVPLSSISLANVQFIHNAQADSIDIYYAGERLVTSLKYRSATPFIELPAFPGLDVSIAPGGSQSDSEAFYTFQPNFENLENYIAFTFGFPDITDPDSLFGLNIIADTRLESSEEGTVDVLLYHGAPDQVGLDVNAQTAPLIFRDIRYNEFSDYVTLPAEDQPLEFQASGVGTLLGTFIGPFASQRNQAVTLFATPMPESEPFFEVWIALPDGGTFPLDFIVDVVENDISLGLEIFPNPVVANLIIECTLEKDLADVFFELIDMNGHVIYQDRYDYLPAGQHDLTMEMADLPSGSYILKVYSSISKFQGIKLLVKK